MPALCVGEAGGVSNFLVARGIFFMSSAASACHLGQPVYFGALHPPPGPRG